MKMTNKFKSAWFIVRYPLTFAVTIALLFIFFLSTAPSTDKVWVTLVPLVFFWLVVYYGLMSVFMLRKSWRNARITRSLATSTATITTLSLIFSALGSIQLFDIILLIALSILAVFYFERTWPK